MITKSINQSLRGAVLLQSLDPLRHVAAITGRCQTRGGGLQPPCPIILPFLQKKNFEQELTEGLHWRALQAGHGLNLHDHQLCHF